MKSKTVNISGQDLELKFKSPENILEILINYKEEKEDHNLPQYLKNKYDFWRNTEIKNNNIPDLKRKINELFNVIKSELFPDSRFQNFMHEISKEGTFYKYILTNADNNNQQLRILIPKLIEYFWIVSQKESEEQDSALTHFLLQKNYECAQGTIGFLDSQLTILKAKPENLELMQSFGRVILEEVIKNQRYSSLSIQKHLIATFNYILTLKKQDDGFYLLPISSIPLTNAFIFLQNYEKRVADILFEEKVKEIESISFAFNAVNDFSNHLQLTKFASFLKKNSLLFNISAIEIDYDESVYSKFLKLDDKSCLKWNMEVIQDSLQNIFCNYLTTEDIKGKKVITEDTEIITNPYSQDVPQKILSLILSNNVEEKLIGFRLLWALSERFAGNDPEPLIKTIFLLGDNNSNNSKIKVSSGLEILAAMAEKLKNNLEISQRINKTITNVREILLSERDQERNIFYKDFLEEIFADEKKILGPLTNLDFHLENEEIREKKFASFVMIIKDYSRYAYYHPKIETVMYILCDQYCKKNNDNDHHQIDSALKSLIQYSAEKRDIDIIKKAYDFFDKTQIDSPITSYLTHEVSYLLIPEYKKFADFLIFYQPSSFKFLYEKKALNLEDLKRLTKIIITKPEEYDGKLSTISDIFNIIQEKEPIREYLEDLLKITKNKELAEFLSNSLSNLLPKENFSKDVIKFTKLFLPGDLVNLFTETNSLITRSIYNNSEKLNKEIFNLNDKEKEKIAKDLGKFLCNKILKEVEESSISKPSFFGRINKFFISGKKNDYQNLNPDGIFDNVDFDTAIKEFYALKFKSEEPSTSFVANEVRQEKNEKLLRN